MCIRDSILGSGISQRTGNTKFTLLVSIAIFLFIIFQGWYHIFLNISRFWFIAVILLGGFWAVLHRMAPASGGGGNVSRGMKNAMGDFVRRKMLDIITKEEEDLRKKIEDRFKKLEGILDTIKKAPPGSEERAAAIMEFRRMCTDLEACIKELSDKGKIGDVKVLNYTRDYWDRYGKLTEKFRKMAE